ncbi:serine protease inhibitor 3/4-like isoform X16 [Rhynchophorus ferrugineus]|uniref:serine protease inhibitor 3/4-like isoform X16 n=1 Tax=Rhynchophorus ferrugineus TaxID=354439 RepID=UPI003FCE0939
MKPISLLVAMAMVIMASASGSLTALEEFSAGNRLFSARLYKEVLLENQNKNFVFSPLSAQIILALTQAGARGQTAQEFSTAVNLPEDVNKTEEAIRQLLPTLKSTHADISLSAANKMYLGKGIVIKKAFETLAVSSFQAAAENLDFAKSTEATNIINHWVEEKTNEKIKDLIPLGALDASTRLVLVNALYFKGKWNTPFETYLTRKEPFHVSKTQTKQVDMMHVEDFFNYYECTKRNVKFLELPYLDDRLTMTIVLPNEIDGLASLENNIESLLTPPPYNKERVAVSMPKWLTETSVDLKGILERLGLRKAFSDSADFKNLSDESLQIGQVLQKSFINVTESGTEAAAATVVRLRTHGLWLHPRMLPIDHSFIYYLKVDDLILFIGKVANVSK